MGIATLVLGCGDAFHLIPRVMADWMPGDFTAAKGVGMLVTSVTMTVFYLLLGIYFVISLGVILYSYFRKKEISRKIIALLFLPEVVALVCFFGGRFMTDRIELLPAGYVFAQIMYLLITQRIGLYDISETAIDSLMQTGTTGFISFDFKMNYLGSNETAKNIYPELKTMTVDRNISRNRTLAGSVMPWRAEQPSKA